MKNKSIMYLLILSFFLNVTWEAKSALSFVVGLLVSKAAPYVIYGSVTAFTAFACKKWTEWNVCKQLQKAQLHRESLHVEALKRIGEVQSSVCDQLATLKQDLASDIVVVDGSVKKLSADVIESRRVLLDQLGKVQEDSRRGSQFALATLKALCEFELRSDMQSRVLLSGQTNIMRRQDDQGEILQAISGDTTCIKEILNRGLDIKLSPEQVSLVASIVVQGVINRLPRQVQASPSGQPTGIARLFHYFNWNSNSSLSTGKNDLDGKTPLLLPS